MRKEGVLCVDLGEVVATSQAKLRDVDGNRIKDGEAAVCALMWDDHGVSAFW